MMPSRSGEGSAQAAGDMPKDIRDQGPPLRGIVE